MADSRPILSTLLYCLWWPVSLILSAILIPSYALLALVQFALLPFTHLAQALLNVVLLPVRLHLLDRIETLYIYLGTATLLGLATGTFLYLLFPLLTTTLSIDPATEQARLAAKREAQKQRQDRTIAEFRAKRREKRRGYGRGGSGGIGSGEAILAKKSSTLGGSGSMSEKKNMAIGPVRRRGLLSQTIIEEEDSDF